mmetsp:Transcript_9504/g.21571  ORF Transcript_9504/g.21571 Transcript_9504/m.21571 type:complete len:214 (-) Transcript_9504:5797-6438(-)
MRLLLAPATFFLPHSESALARLLLLHPCAGSTQPLDGKGARCCAEVDWLPCPGLRCFVAFVVTDINDHLLAPPPALAEDALLGAFVPPDHDGPGGRVEVHGPPLRDIGGPLVVVVFRDALHGSASLRLLGSGDASEANRLVALVSDPECFPCHLIELVFRVLFVELFGQSLERNDALHIELLPAQALLTLGPPRLVDEGLHHLAQAHAATRLG